ncbi:MAG TPA: hypothetical protein PLE61_07370 [Vicinamibacterales bacterium]|nr:hypothetical protein [Vicinamibacterales bacterium]HPW20618.1 hypothetical protein [Vicinamibacterales bacterium]
MASSAGPMTPQQVWREMSAEQRLAAARALWADEDSAPQQAEAIQALARQLRFRPQSLLRLSPDRLARHLAGVRAISAPLASRALVVYHLAGQRPMLEAFLAHLGVPHEHGVISDGPTEPPGEDRLQAAAAALLERFPAADVRVYLLTLAAQDPGVWGRLAPIADAIAAGPPGADAP